MSFIVFLQILANVAFATGLFVAFARLRRPAKDDPRLSKGLQLLSSKIAVLEDLSDRTETQVQQMLLLLDQKSKELQSKIALADQQVAAVRQSMNQSLEVAQIFQDKIPHSEIIERQNSVKYIRAARLAHAGVSVAEIAREVDLPLGEIEFIAKVNHENLSFREEDLPAWARDPNAMAKNSVDHLSMAASITPTVTEHMPVPALDADQEGLVQRLSKLQFEMQNLDLELAHRSSRNVMPDMTQAFEPPRLDSSSLERLGEEFRRAVEAAEKNEKQDFASEASKDSRETLPEKLHWSAALPNLDNSSASEEKPAMNLTRPSAGYTVPTKPAAPIAAKGVAAPTTTTNGVAIGNGVMSGVAASTPTAAANTGANVVASTGAGATANTNGSATLAREVSVPELEAARAAAAALRTKDQTPVSVQTLNGPQTVTKTVRRVEFPRI